MRGALKEQMAETDSARIVIVGGGVIGLGIAYHLGAMGERDVLLLERNTLTSGTSWHAAGIVGPLRANANLTKLAIYATELFPRLEAETGQGTGYRRTGGLWLARNEDRMVELRRISAMGEMAGLDARMITAKEAGEQAGNIRHDDLCGALWVSEDGQANPVDICMAYAKGAKARGVRIREGARVEGFEIAKGRVAGVRLAGGEVISCNKVVLAAGAWSRDLAASVGVPVPLQAVEHMYVVTEPIADLRRPYPIVRDLDGGIYIKEDAGRLVIGGFELNAKPWDPAGPDGDRPFLELPEDWEQFEPFMQAGLHRIPKLADVGIQHFMNGPESFTPDTRQMMGESPFLPGFFVAAGFNSIGMMSSAGVGKALAQWIVAGEAPMDLWAVDIARFDSASAARPFLRARVQEAVGNQFQMHWPLKQMKTGRDLRRGALHEAFAAAGAVLGAPTGWERPLWFAASEAEREFRYSYGAQCWWDAAKRECEAIRDRVALLELSPFTKIDVCGRDALRFLQLLCANDIDVAEGRAVYTQMLNDKGGIEADVTVTRTGETVFRIVSGAATRWKDLAWLHRHRRDLAAEVCDATSAEAVIGVVGPDSRELLQKLTDADLSNVAFPFGASREISLGPAGVRLTRVSFTGELGYEVYVPNELARTVYDAIAAHGPAHAGHYALDCCRIEKGFRHWSHDIGPEETPLEAGLGFAVAWEKPGGFLGREALLRQREAGVTRRLLHFALPDGARPLLLHDEPIYRGGKLVGRTTSGNRGFRTGLSLALGFVACESGMASRDLLGRYEIGVAGERFAATALARAPYDPDGQRLRG
jgi:4-methylaminobutanoate oxidase (formaldehyde-forming)